MATTAPTAIQTPRFTVGRLVMTPGVVAHFGGDAIGNPTMATPLAMVRAARLVHRHQHGDWGVLDTEDIAANEAALRHGDRLLSAYEEDGERVYVITEWDRSLTTVLLASEY